MEDNNDLRNLKKLTGHDELKFVIGSRDDYDYAKKILGHGELITRQIKAVNLSPLFGQMEPRTLVGWILEDHLEVRLNLQLHKYIWGPDVQGV